MGRQGVTCATRTWPLTMAKGSIGWWWWKGGPMGGNKTREWGITSQ